MTLALQSLTPGSAPPPAIPSLTLSTDPHLPPIVAQARRILAGDDVILRQLADAAGGFAVNLALAALILAATIWAANVLSGAVSRAIGRTHRGKQTDTTLQSFASSLVRYSVVIVGLVGVLDQLGVRATSVIAVLGAASLAIGLALQGALSNVAAGVMILVLRPYRVGDDVKINNKEGVVTGLDLFSTRLADPDNLTVFVPNSKAFGEIIVNHTAPARRRVAFDVTIDREDDVETARRLMLACANGDRRVASEPAPWAHITAVAANGWVMTLRCYTTPTDYGDAFSDLLLAVIRSFCAEGLTIPYPHQVSVQGRPFEPGRAVAERVAAAKAEPPNGEARSFAPRGDGDASRRN